MPKIFDFEEVRGLIFNNLKIIDYAGKNKHGQILIKFLCNCGEYTIATLGSVKIGHTKSCGCYIGNRGAVRKYDPLYSEFLVMQRANNGRKKPYEWTLSFELFSKLILESCFYCGQEPATKSKKNGSGKDGKDSFLRNGIDRVDNNIGYIDGNCVACCQTCNFMKCALGGVEFINQCIQIINFQNKI